MRNVFIIGSKGIPGNYGGFETFVDQLVSRQNSEDIHYYVSCLSDNNDLFTYKGATCFNVKVPKIGSAAAVIYDLLGIKRCLDIIKEKSLDNCLLVILACRIGPFMSYYQRQFHKLGIKVYLNPDGHEWKRSKWNSAIKAYWKYSEKLMIKNTDLAICDSIAIENYIKEEYKRFAPKTKFIAYGADTTPSIIEDNNEELLSWYEKHDIKLGDFYLVVGRFVPENNYETVIKEFMMSKSSKDLVIITNIEENAFYNNLKENTGFHKDSRVKFVGPLYEPLVKKVREQSYAYIHGHEVGGTNPSLLEGLASTNINMCLDVVFNKEVADDGALYFTKASGSLASLIEKVDRYKAEDIKEYSVKAKKRIDNFYSWEFIVDSYEKTFLD
jgi:rhamnosyltransferase